MFIRQFASTITSTSGDQPPAGTVAVVASYSSYIAGSVVGQFVSKAHLRAFCARMGSAKRHNLDTFSLNV